MATRWSAWASAVAGLVVGAAVGFAAASFTRSDTVDAPSDASARRSDPGVAALSSRVDEILERLRGLEAAVQGRAESASGGVVPSATTTPVRTDDGLRELIERRCNELEEAIRRIGAGVGELSKLKPTPDVEAVTAYGRELVSDPSRASQRIVGYTYRDALLEFGSPTSKLSGFQRVHGPNGGRITMWVWDLADAGKTLYLSFEDGVAHYAYFGESTNVRNYIAEMSK